MVDFRQQVTGSSYIGTSAPGQAVNGHDSRSAGASSAAAATS